VTNRILYLAGPGPFKIRYDLPETFETLGLRLSVDGDNTDSNFDLLIKRIKLRTERIPWG
jgi:hypothetical protein